MTGRVGRSLKPVDPKLVIKPCSLLLEAFKHVKSFYHDFVKTRFSRLSGNIKSIDEIVANTLGNLHTGKLKQKLGGGGRSIPNLEGVLNKYQKVSSKFVTVTTVVKGISENQMLGKLRSVRASLSASESAQLLDLISKGKKEYRQAPIVFSQPVSIEANPMLPSAPPLPPVLAKASYANSSIPLVSAYSESQFLDRIQHKTDAVMGDVENLLTVFSQDLIPSSNRFSEHAQSISKAYQDVFSEHSNQQKAPKFLEHFNRVLAKESAGLGLIETLSSDESLQKKLGQSMTIPDRAKELCDDITLMKEDAQLILAKFNSVKSFFEESSMRTRISLLKSDISLIQNDNHSYADLKQTIELALDDMSHKLGRIDEFIRSFEEEEYQFLNEFAASPREKLQTMLTVIHDSCMA